MSKWAELVVRVGSLIATEGFLVVIILATVEIFKHFVEEEIATVEFLRIHQK